MCDLGMYTKLSVGKQTCVDMSLNDINERVKMSTNHLL